ncbi:MAG: hypothetical protein HQ581_05490 [Planctomycetes bacterium]|nr:hypothetical protein [Planctomycetota bacterium]
MRRFFMLLATAGILAAVAAGCGHNCYVVEITPEGDGIQRKLTCWYVDSEGRVSALPDDELEKLVAIYGGRETPDSADKHVFMGEFGEKMPDDFGGAGSYTHWETSMGSTSAYIERFGGSDDLEAGRAKQRQAADQLADLVAGWLETELGDEPGFDRLKKFLDNEFRRDLKNLGLYGWIAMTMAAPEQGKGSEQDGKGVEVAARAWQYLSERDYLRTADLPVIARSVAEDDPQRVLDLVGRLVARRMGIADEEPIPPALAFLGDPEKLEKSISDYVKTTDLYKQRLAGWKKEQKQIDPEPQGPPDEDGPRHKEEPPTPEEVVGDLVTDCFAIAIFPAGDTLEVKLACPVKPFSTNGQWQAKSKKVSWSTEMSDINPLPAFCFAVWSEPDEAFQQKHFGQIVLADEALTGYATWYRSLEGEEKNRWDRFLDRCTPGDDLVPAIRKFRFVEAPADLAEDEAPPADLADMPRGMLLEGLGISDEKKQ